MTTNTIERTNTLARPRTILDRAKSDDGDLTAAEQETVESAIARVKRIDARAWAASLFDRVMALGKGIGLDGLGGVHQSSFFTPVAKAGIVHAVTTRTAYRADLSSKTALTTGTLLPTSGS